MRRFLAMALGAMWVTAAMAADEACCAAMGITNEAGLPMSIELTLKDCSLADGVKLQAKLTNTGAEPCSLKVCSAMQLCCVRGLHPLILFDNAGLGLVDLCTKSNPVSTNAVVAPQGSYALDLAIPVARLPEGARAAGKKFGVVLCYELAEGKLVHSNVVQAELK